MARVGEKFDDVRHVRQHDDNDDIHYRPYVY